MDEHDHKHDHVCDKGHLHQLTWWELWPMAGWGLFVLYLWGKGMLDLLVWPVYGYLAAAGGVVLLATFAAGLWLRRRRRRRIAARGEELPKPPFSWWRAARSLLFVVPILIGVSLPERGLGRLAAIQRGATDPAQALQIAEQRERERAEMRGAYQWTSVIGVTQRLREDRAQKVGALGFVVRTDKMPKNRFLLVRLLMTCCAADAQPVSVPVEWEKAETLESDEFVEVYGTTDPDRNVVVADMVEEPDGKPSPYIY